jgi:AcrR family transcriptional regulator
MASGHPARAYEMENRTRQASETRRRIVEAAAELFESEGYAGTSIASIADAAGVAVPTVYASMRSKANILRGVIDLTIRGDVAALPLAAREPWLQMEQEPDPRRRLELFARIHREIGDREAAIFAQLEAAAGGDSEAAEMLSEHDRRRYETQSRLARSLHRQKQLKRGLGARRATDVIWVLASERTYLALVRDRGWKPRAYERWVADQLAAALLPPEDRR